MTPIRLVALDIDGTLLDDDKNVPEENVKALRDATEAGVHVAISSGRMLSTIEPVEERLGIDAAIIAYNGGKVVGPRSEGRVTVDHRPVSAEVAGEFIDLTRERGYLLNFYHEDRLYADDGGDRERFMELYSSRTTSLYHVVDLDGLREKAPTKLILLTEPEEVDRLLETLPCRYDGRVSLTKSEPEYLEITAPGVSKGSALPVLAAHYGLSLAEVLAMGDAPNDNEMLRAAGVGVAVANACPETREAADAVTERTNSEGAVAEAVYRWVL